MTRGTQSRLAALCTCALAIAMIVPVTAAAAPSAAQEEYLLDLPGVKTGSPGAGGAALAAQADAAGPVGVVGEQDDDFTRLGAVSAAVVTPGGAAIGVLLIAGAALATIHRRRRA